MKRMCVLLLAMSLLLSGCSTEWVESIVKPPRKVEIGGQTVTVDRHLKENQLTAEDFVLDPETGRISCQARKALTGIDVSSHQGEIDWSAVAADGVDFAILRIAARGYTEGKLLPDQMFERNYAAAMEQGLDVGVYIFSQAISEEEAVEEADYVLSLLQGRELQMPIVFDWEQMDNVEARTDAVDSETVTDAALAFCRRVEEAGYESTVYCNGMVGYLRYDLARMQDLDLWYAEYGSWPDFAYEFRIWQYSHTGTVNGIFGNVDLNLYFLPGTYE